MHSEIQEPHEMILEKTHDSGAEEWYCPSCGRRFLMQWPPEYKKVVLEQGDENAAHTGGKGDIKMGPPRVDLYTTDPVSDEDLESESLQPWLEWFNQKDFESLWHKDL